MQAVLAGYRLHDKLKGLNLVASHNGVSIFEVNLMLAGCHFMVRCFNFEAHFFQC
ncbi:hypothetical protein D3C81_2093520 [compost metagenome]